MVGSPFAAALHGRPPPPGSRRRHDRPGPRGPRAAHRDLDRRRESERTARRRLPRRLHLHVRHAVGARPGRRDLLLRRGATPPRSRSTAPSSTSSTRADSKACGGSSWVSSPDASGTSTRRRRARRRSRTCSTTASVVSESRCYCGLPLGHGATLATLPLGVQATVDADALDADDRRAGARPLGRRLGLRPAPPPCDRADGHLAGAVVAQVSRFRPATGIRKCDAQGRALRLVDFLTTVVANQDGFTLLVVGLPGMDFRREFTQPRGRSEFATSAAGSTSRALRDRDRCRGLRRRANAEDGNRRSFSRRDTARRSPGDVGRRATAGVSPSSSPTCASPRRSGSWPRPRFRNLLLASGIAASQRAAPVRKSLAVKSCAHDSGMKSFRRRGSNWPRRPVVGLELEETRAPPRDQLLDRGREFRIHDRGLDPDLCLPRYLNVIGVPRTVTWDLRSVVIPKVRDVWRSVAADPEPAEIDQPHCDRGHLLRGQAVERHVRAIAARSSGSRSAKRISLSYLACSCRAVSGW